MSFLVPSITQSVPVVSSGAVSLAWSAQVGTGPNSGSFTDMEVWRAQGSFAGKGTVSGSVLTVTAVTSGALVNGAQVAGDGIAAGTTISSFGTGTGGIGTYNLSASSTVSVAETIVGSATALAKIATLDPSTVVFVDTTALPNADYIYRIQGLYSNVGFATVTNTNDEVGVTPAFNDAWNCNCESVSPWDTLANLRIRMFNRLGYPNQSASPPPGMASMLNQFLYDAQQQLYKQLNKAGLRTERFFNWTMVPGQRYYALNASEGDCSVLLDPLKVKWVGFEDLNQAWYRLDEGIPPEYYTRANISFGWPTRYEIRACIEIFPAPQAAYTLWVKGDFGLASFTNDGDRATIDDQAVYMLALGNAKAHYGQGDAQLVLKQAGDYVKGMVAGTHGTRRYVPQAAQENPLTPPRFLPLGNNQA